MYELDEDHQGLASSQLTPTPHPYTTSPHGTKRLNHKDLKLPICIGLTRKWAKSSRYVPAQCWVPLPSPGQHGSSAPYE